MAIAWFIVPMLQRTPPDMPRPVRYCGMDNFTAQINADGGAWAESECLGGWAVVKVRANAGTLTTIAGAANFQRIPSLTLLTAPLSSLSTAQRTAIRNKLNAMGYTDAEIIGALGSVNLNTVTLGQVLRFAASRRLKPRWDDINLQIVLDGIFQACRPIDEVDQAVS